MVASGSVRAQDLPLSDENPLEMPNVGRYGLRVVAPNLLELTRIGTKAPDPGGVDGWDFVDSNFALSAAPGATEFTVTVAGQQVGVTAVGFKRRPIYAPLKHRDLRIGNYLYLQLASSVGEGQIVEVKNPNARLWPEATQLVVTADPLRWSPAIHVNQVGYGSTFPKKAMVGLYLGSLGELSVPAQNGFQLVDASGAVVFQGQLNLRLDQGFTYSPAPYHQVWEADFSSVQTPGDYRVVVPGLGASFPFQIGDGVAAAFARAYALGVFHQRCGMSEQYPFTRHVHDVCHAAPVQVPNMSFTAVNNELANMTSDYANFQTAPRLKDVSSSLYPFVDLSDRDVSGGHHDAGDYSRYTINSAGFIHYLTFAVDAFPGVAALDNMGLPESGDGISDVLQEAKWEADFLAKMQDSDGGFYFLVYPRDREYEDDVLPDKGDPQVVFPKTTSVTAAAVAALAEAGSSPAFKQQFPEEAARYIQKAELGWAFLQNAIAKYGKAGAYQKITHYGNEFTHDDELAWAACALFVATGDQTYHDQLKAWFDPSDPNTRRWSWWRLFEGYGCAVRTYAFAARSGRLPASALDPVYLSKCEAEIQAAAADHVRFARESAYGTSFPDPNKAYRSAGWYFSSERAFDITVAYQLTPRNDYLEAVIGNLNYEAGCNPINQTYITGLGSKRQREIVHQYAENDRRVLPPSGIPLGNIQAGFQYLDAYKTDLEGTTFPADGVNTAPYPYYDRWSDSFNTTTEFVITDQARSLASLAFWMAQTPLKDQPWKSATGQIAGLPSQVPADQTVTAILQVPGVDLTGARVVWEARDQEPRFGNPVTFAAKSAGEQWVEVEAQLPDGRRIFATTNFLATTASDTLPNADESGPVALTSDVVALYHLDSDLADATGKQKSLVLGGRAQFDSSNLGWLTVRQGAALHFSDLGDKATVLIPSKLLRSGSDTTAIILEAMVYVDAFVAYNRDTASIVSLSDRWDAYLEFGEDKYAGPFIRGGTKLEVIGSNLTNALVPKQWHHLAIELNKVGYVVRLDGSVLASASGNELNSWGNVSSAKLELGNFSGWIDEVVVRSVRTGAPPNNPPTVNVVSPSAGATFSAPATIALAAYASDTDGRIASVDFYSGTNKIGSVSSGAYPYTYLWNGVEPGIYSITATATDDKGASSSSLPVVVTVAAPLGAVAAPVISPSGGSYAGALNVELATSTPGATIRYTLDGTEPDDNSPVYPGALLLSSTATLKSKAFKSGLSASDTAGATFALTTLASSGARVTFVASDDTTQGDWKGVYGANGFFLLPNSSWLPSSLQLTSSGQADYTWGDPGSDTRALQLSSGAGRTIGCWSASTSFSLGLNFTDGKTHRVAFYFLDWDQAGRSELIEILDAADNRVLNAQTLAEFTGGKYLIWDLKGRVKVRITRLSGPNAMLSGIFLDPKFAKAGDVAVAPILSGPFSSVGNTSGTMALHISGEAGQEVAIETSSDLTNWTLVSTQTMTTMDLDVAASGSNIDPHHQFYRARSVASAQPQYVIEASLDLIHWVPVSLSNSPDDLPAFAQSEAGEYPSRFYRARLLSAQ